MCIKFIWYICKCILILDENTTLVQGSALLKQAVRKVVSLMHDVPVLDSKTADLPKLGLRASVTPFIHLTSSPCLNIRYTNISVSSKLHLHLKFQLYYN
jgi:hypothetical protein